MSDFCTIHAFYDCPVCRGEEPVWVIPVVNDRTGLQTGEIIIGEGQVMYTGDVELPIPSQVVVVQTERLPSEIFPSPPVDTTAAKVVHATREEEPPEGQKPDLIWFAYNIDLEAARERGRLVYAKAVELAKREDIPLAEALVRVGEDERA